MPQHILLLGATGSAGTAIRQALLDQTDVVTTLVSRHANHLTPVAGRERIAQLDVHDETALNQAMTEQDIVVSALSAERDDNELASLAEAVMAAMATQHIRRLIFMVAMGIYNEIPATVGAQDNVEHNPLQIHNLKAARVIEDSALNYTLLRPGFLVTGDSAVTITQKGEPVTNNTTSLASVGSVVVQLITGKLTANRASLGLNQPAKN
ncbi:NAD(P)H-binding protein [Lactiplantibacillus pentosus]|uniref:NAD(P)H-binding protein n=1 Tax=Lactiplantibacillus pentosus TaxID=1589 RepID=UPI001C1ECAE1|nr:NAD(P)H-binding protein [Lactiplantibacillus pentosus]MBU7464538.1 NAD(P)H-binding protein [Lactiplantibacillus pentosus]MBU7490196.1 NAD(P)H-binding protein [Lactiplantibacillus pentosus]MBU7495131.1 NAD(P)H-binding protein [Lactiplantibacillus pentosus]MBU7521073.1 NAD(P)H-binding protein [Lactiplantibacillus pentosus]MBU7526158.1 NAD(P)H-binding protein [Lactiplantibacillus pentosus]